jgi:hypothetical protein
MILFILLSGRRALISSVIFGERSEFESAINRIKFDFRSSSLILPPPPPPYPLRPNSPVARKHTVTSPSPQLRDVGSKNNILAPSEARTLLPPPLPLPTDVGPGRGMQATSSVIDSGVWDRRDAGVGFKRSVKKRHTMNSCVVSLFSSLLHSATDWFNPPPSSTPPRQPTNAPHRSRPPDSTRQTTR